MLSRSNSPWVRQLGVAVGIAAVLLLAGCSDSSAPRSVLTVLSVNDNDALSSDIVNYGSDGLAGTADDFVFEDRVPVSLRSADHDGVVDVFQNGPYGYIFIDSYNIHFESEEEIQDVNGSLGWSVPAHADFQGNLPIVPASLKSEAPLSSLLSGGEILATAHITLRGHEQTSNAPIKLETTLPVHFANWVDPN